MNIIDNYNRTEIQRKYVDHLISNLESSDLKRELWNYLNSDKNKYSNYSLEVEISRDAPKILSDIVNGSLHLQEFVSYGPTSADVDFTE